MKLVAKNSATSLKFKKQLFFLEIPLHQSQSVHKLNKIIPTIVLSAFPSQAFATAEDSIKILHGYEPGIPQSIVWFVLFTFAYYFQFKLSKWFASW